MHIEKIIPNTEAGKSVAGKKLPCKYCGAEAYIALEEGRYMVNCTTCGAHLHLKTYNHLATTSVI